MAWIREDVHTETRRMMLWSGAEQVCRNWATQDVTEATGKRWRSRRRKSAHDLWRRWRWRWWWWWNNGYFRHGRTQWKRRRARMRAVKTGSSLISDKWRRRWRVRWRHSLQGRIQDLTKGEQTTASAWSEPITEVWRSRGRAPGGAKSFLYTFIRKKVQKLRIWVKRYKVKYARLCYVIGL